MFFPLLNNLESIRRKLKDFDWISLRFSHSQEGLACLNASKCWIEFLFHLLSPPLKFFNLFVSCVCRGLLPSDFDVERKFISLEMKCAHVIATTSCVIIWQQQHKQQRLYNIVNGEERRKVCDMRHSNIRLNNFIIFFHFHFIVSVDMRWRWALKRWIQANYREEAKNSHQTSPRAAARNCEICFWVLWTHDNIRMKMLKYKIFVPFVQGEYLVDDVVEKCITILCVKIVTKPWLVCVSDAGNDSTPLDLILIGLSTTYTEAERETTTKKVKWKFAGTTTSSKKKKSWI